MRIQRESKSLPHVERGEPVNIQVDRQAVTAYAGETVAAALMALGVRVFRHTEKNGAPRSLFCGMGICFDCLVTIDGEPNVRACMTLVQEGMIVETADDRRD